MPDPILDRMFLNHTRRLHDEAKKTIEKQVDFLEDHEAYTIADDLAAQITYFDLVTYSSLLHKYPEPVFNAERDVLVLDKLYTVSAKTTFIRVDRTTGMAITHTRLIEVN